jgi:glycosyltransferase 2 family protein
VSRASRLVAMAIALIGLALVVRELVRHWGEVADALSGASTMSIGAAAMLAGLSMTTIGLAWRRCLAVLGASHPAAPVLRSYFVGQLGKYVPGGVWPVVGRAEMARRIGVAPGVAYGSTVLSMGVTYLGAVLVAVAALLIDAAERRGPSGWLLVAVLVGGVCTLHPRVGTLVTGAVQKVARRPLGVEVPSWRTSIGLLALHAPAWIGIGAATWLIAGTLDPAGAPNFANVLFATATAWFLGFVAVGVPGGIGVREATFVAAATSISSVGIAAAIALVARVLFILVDLGLAALAVGGAALASRPSAEKS